MYRVLPIVILILTVDAQGQSEVDLVVSGHTHGGQLMPFNMVGEWTGANE